MINKFRKLPGNVQGTLWALAATAMFVVAGALVKLASADYHVVQILLFRQFVMLSLVIPTISRHFPQSLKTQRLGLHLVRLGGALVALFLGFTALAHLPLATATTLSFAKMFFVTLIAIPMVGEKVGWYRFSAILVGFIGVLVMLKPDPETAISPYAFVAVMGAAGAALAVVSVRRLSKTESTVTLISYQGLFVGGIVILPAFWYWQTPDLRGFVLLFLIGLVSFVAQWLGVQSYRAGEVSVVTGMEYTKLIYATLIGIFVFSEWPEFNTLIGAAIIISAAIYTIIREARRAT